MSAAHNPQKALVYCADLNVLPFALFSAQNAALHAPDRNYDILICSLDPLDIPKAFLTLGIRNHVLDLRDQIASLNLAEKWLPETAFLRMFLSQELGDTYDRILYLDCDTNVVNEGIFRLFSLDFAPHPVAAVRDVAQWYRLSRRVMDFKARGISGQTCFNSGMQLVDTARYREMGCLEKMLAVHKDPRPTEQNDQSLFNLGLMGHIAELHPNWNWQWTHKEPYLSALASPNIVHYVGWIKPWSDQVFTRTNYSYELYNRYRRFIARHFPDRLADFSALDKPRRNWLRSVGHMSVQVGPALSLYRNLRRFKSELDVLR
ncbi:glycosyltransferase family 8 protein [Shimia sediminis]|uniref:glycosyltransferase family 8 protein n=1 Tax=Shimia sediminis TaxID=2497945 RepID=UPI000F8CC7BA|nr:glycosyltransferase [Shimia sediminis]